MSNDNARREFPSYIPPPHTLAAFPEARKAKPKSSKQAGPGLRRRWKDSTGVIYEWDYLHGTVEQFDARGRHLGEFDPDSGVQLKPANPNYRVEP